MKRLIATLIVVAAVLVAWPVFAADMAYKAPYYAAPVAPVPYTWTGFYVGLNGGAGWGMDSASVTSVSGSSTSFSLPVESQPSSGWLAGFTAGYNWQTGPMVFGVEGEFDWTDINGGTACLTYFNCGVKQTWLGDIAGRVGVATPGIPMLMYVKGGLAWSDFSYGFGNTLGGTTISAAASDVRMGGLVGFGIEYAFLTNWSAKVEYDFIDFGSNGVAFQPTISSCTGCTIPSVGTSIRDTESLVKAGLNYKLPF